MKKNFTLIEIMAVVFLIGVLSAIGFGVYGYAMNSAKEGSTKALIARIGAALDSCNTKFGYYPPSDTAGQFNTIQFTLNTNGTIDNISFRGDVGTATKRVSAEYRDEFLKVVDAENLKRYLELVSGTTYELRDAWGVAVYFAYPGRFNTTSYDLVSAGADGVFGNSSTRPATPSSTTKSDYKDSNGAAVCDDIFNF